MTSPDQSADAFRLFLERARAGEQSAFDELLGLSEPRLRRYIDKRLGPTLRSKMRDSDVLQNAYLAMLSALSSFEGQTLDDLVAWMTRIIEHDIQRQNRWFGAAKRVAPDRTSERNALARILLETPQTPSREVAADEERIRIQEALDRLTPDHAEIIRLAVFDELSHREIAAQLDRSERACRALLFRARAALAVELDDETQQD